MIHKHSGSVQGVLKNLKNRKGICHIHMVPFFSSWSNCWIFCWEHVRYNRHKKLPKIYLRYCQAQVQVQVRCRSGSGQVKRKKLKDLDLSYTLNLFFHIAACSLHIAACSPPPQTLQHSHLLHAPQQNFSATCSTLPTQTIQPLAQHFHSNFSATRSQLRDSDDFKVGIEPLAPSSLVKFFSHFKLWSLKGVMEGALEGTWRGTWRVNCQTLNLLVKALKTVNSQLSLTLSLI